MNTNQKLEKYQSILPTVMAIIFGVFLVGAAVMTAKSFPLYAFGGTFGANMRQTVWAIMTLPAVILPISLLLTNMLGHKFSGAFILLSFLCCAFFVAMRIVYSYTSDTTANYLLCLGSFYLIFLCFFVGLNEIVKPKISNKIAGIIIPLVFLLAYGIGLIVIVKYEIVLPYFTRTIICASLPIIMLVFLLIFLSLKLCSKASVSTKIIMAILPIFGIFLSVYEFSFSRIAILLYIGIFTGLLIKIIFDVFTLKTLKK